MPASHALQAISVQKSHFLDAFDHFPRELDEGLAAASGRVEHHARLAEAPSYGLPGVVFDPAARGSQAFVEFAREMVERIQKM